MLLVESTNDTWESHNQSPPVGRGQAGLGGVGGKGEGPEVCRVHGGSSTRSHARVCCRDVGPRAAADDLVPVGMLLADAAGEGCTAQCPTLGR